MIFLNIIVFCLHFAQLKDIKTCSLSLKTNKCEFIFQNIQTNLKK